jgi:malonyl CoA-acyl carrier protein transacylase
MKQLTILIAMVIGISGCANFTMPSNYDPNESKGMIDVLQDVRALDCRTDASQQAGIKEIQESVEWMRLYTDIKGSEDVFVSLGAIDHTLTGMIVRDNMSVGYCKLKKKNLTLQVSDTAQAVMKRYGE